MLRKVFFHMIPLRLRNDAPPFARTRTPRTPRAPRGVTLIEMMVVIAILGVLAAIAAPQLLPIMKRSRLNSEAESVASFLHGVRERAIAKNRCYRVLVRTDALTAEERDSGDCASTVSLTNDGWNAASSRLVAEAGTRFTYLQATPDCLSCTATPDTDIVFRPSGRLRGDNDLVISDDKVRIHVTQSGLTEHKTVVIMASGRTCVIHHAGAVAGPMTPATANNDCNLAIP